IAQTEAATSTQTESNQAEVGRGAEDVAQAIAGGFPAVSDCSDQQEVLNLHQQGIGFGAIFKLCALAAAKGTTVEAVLATIPKNDGGQFEFAFGKLFKGLTEQQQTVLASLPKNLGE